MRHDMAKVVAEVPRRNRCAEAYVRKGRVRNLDDLPSREGMKAGRRRGWNRKEPAENLNPLRRFLESRVGRPWDDVFSEVCSLNDPRNPVQAEVRRHILWMVDIDCWRDASGDVLVSGRFGVVLPAGPLYVDPDDGVLRKVQRRSRRRTPESDPKVIEVSDGLRLQRIDGIWHEVSLRPIPEPRIIDVAHPDGRTERRAVARPVWDAVRREWLRVRDLRSLRDPRYAASKRHLARRELARRGLENDMALHEARVDKRRRAGGDRGRL